MTEIELYSAALCPFAHRTRLALIEKGLPFKLIEIDLRNKPENFKEISPYGKVPVLKHGKNRVWESAIINEYLEETFPERPLLPQAPIQRAQARIWINFADTRLFATTGKVLYTHASQPPTEALQELTKHLQFIEAGLQTMASTGPYWLGSEVSLVDLTYYPWFEQWTVLEQYRGFEFPTGLDRLKQWWKAIAARDSVRAIAQPQNFYIERYAQFEATKVG
ncbi:glutathione S-transferase family protein [Leptolyngbya sp. FACHB-671]|uniref:glutathione S-transferase family protein n=1 Tax=Leptolyngbya sp. FACHB-671 TaxID=2692812 RepID=UPI00168325EA|nr:glutathione S-transferase family protein [Leptolyngbya sp. FACHB-671]MBD2072045.1 glutathione S-transferase family protein [Leptolyngbya sp. FACHB-671]